MARIVFEATGTEVWKKDLESATVQLAVVCRTLEGNWQEARERARVCARALNEYEQARLSGGN